MKTLPAILFLLFSSTEVFSQRDTICTRSHDTILCRIYKSNSTYIEYSDKKSRIKTMDMNFVQWYTFRGKRAVAQRQGGLFASKLADTVEAGDELRHLRFCLKKFHAQYSTGMSLSMIGGLSVAGAIVLRQDNTTRQAFGIGGLLLMISGTIVAYDAHKWIGRAGWGVNGKGNEVEIYYRFRK